MKKEIKLTLADKLNSGILDFKYHVWWVSSIDCDTKYDTKTKEFARKNGDLWFPMKLVAVDYAR